MKISRMHDYNQFTTYLNPEFDNLIEYIHKLEERIAILEISNATPRRFSLDDIMKYAEKKNSEGTGTDE